MPIAQPEPAARTGTPFNLTADRQNYVNNVWTGTGDVEVDYRDYVVRADKIAYNRITTELEAEGNLHLTGGPDDLDITASRGDMRLNSHTARFFDVTGTIGVRGVGRSSVYSTANPFIIRARVLLQTGERSYRVIDGSMTNCRLPKPDWLVLSRSIDVSNGTASTRNSYFKFLGVPLFYFPYLRHPVDEGGRESGLLIPEISNSSTRGFTIREEAYWAINRSMDLTVGTEYYSRRGWAPMGEFRFKGRNLDHFTLRWNALFDRGFNQLQTSGPQAGQYININQGGADILALGHKDFSPETRIAGNVEYLSSYTYRLAFNDNYLQAVSSEVKSDVSLTHAHNGLIPSVDVSRLQTFASPSEGDEARILHLPSVRFDILDRPLGDAAGHGPVSVYWGLGSAISHLGRSEPDFHAHNLGRFDLYPHLSVPMVAAGWSIVPEGALRATFYTGSQFPDLTGSNGGVPAVSHDPLRRNYGEVALHLRPPALERDFTLGHGDRILRHVIEPELTYHFVSGIGSVARNVLLVDTSDIATDTNEAGFSLTQRFYLRPANPSERPGSQPCNRGAGTSVQAESQASADAGRAFVAPAGNCANQSHEWASWQIAQKYYFNADFGGAVIPGRRNVFASTLDFTGVSFLTGPRNLSPIVSRMRFEAVQNLRVEWDLDYDPKAGRLGADNVFAGYSWGITTVGVGHALLNAVDQQGSAATLIQSQQLSPFIEIGKQTRTGFNLAANGGYDFVHGALQYGGIQAVYNWDCCGLTLGYRRFALGSARDETQYLYSFTLANFGSVGDIHRTNAVFRDPSASPAY